MPTLYRTTIDVELPAGHVPAAKVIAAVDPIVEAARAALEKAGLKFKIESDTVTPRGPNVAKTVPSAPPSQNQPAPNPLPTDAGGNIVRPGLSPHPTEPIAGTAPKHKAA
jgi:hypothetical protein